MNRRWIIDFALTIVMWTVVFSAGLVVFSWQWWAMLALWIASGINSEVK